MKPPYLKSLGLLVALLGLAGCAVSPQGQSSVRSEVLLELESGNCDTSVVRRVQGLRDPALELQAAYVCIQQMEVEQAERLTRDYQRRHRQQPHQDYAVYLQAVAALVRFELAAEDDRQRLLLGREAHQQFTSFVRDYPVSRYRQESAELLLRLHEGMAASELRLARLAQDMGQTQEALQRLQYVQREYPRSAAATEARVFLQQLGHTLP